ncbi:AfsR/SARP family transcriptional regulator [Phytohabitans suffuscus]|uniref:AfsR/SARP family transcriptional regulator n=1 Tax=Phytohabitans suffuscus TaxID=624315 RepID=UPI0015677C57
MGEEQPEQARRALHSHISRVRQLLSQVDAEPSASTRLAREPGGYLLRVEEERIDGHRFRLLLQSARDRRGLDDFDRTRLIREALTLWRGQPLAGVPGDWAAQVRAGWNAERVDAVVEWARIELRQGNPDEVLAQLTGLTAEHPLVEPLVEVFMRALHATGRSADALDKYAGFRRQLADGLGVDPSSGLQRLYLSILRGEPSQANMAVASPVSSAPQPGTSHLEPAPAPTPPWLTNHVRCHGRRLTLPAVRRSLLESPQRCAQRTSDPRWCRSSTACRAAARRRWPCNWR